MMTNCRYTNKIVFLFMIGLFCLGWNYTVLISRIENCGKLLWKYSSERCTLKPEDIVITIKTAEVLFEDRVSVQLNTWVKLDKSHVYFVTHAVDEKYRRLIGDDHLLITECGDLHKREHLCCKTGEEFALYFSKDKSWWCHVDDDAYVNMKNLVNYLGQFNPDEEDIFTGEITRSYNSYRTFQNRSYNFRHITGGTYCLSRHLAHKIAPWAKGRLFPRMCKEISAPEDMTMAFIVNGLANVSSLHSEFFHSHQKRLDFAVKAHPIQEQITLSYHTGDAKYYQVVPFLGNNRAAFSKEDDPTRFYSIHCLLHPEDDVCPKNSSVTFSDNP